MKKTFLIPACLVATVISVNAQESSAPPPPPPPPPPKIETVKFTPPVIVEDNGVQEFYARNPAVEGVSWKSSKKIIITLRNKKKEVYDLSKLSEKEAFKAKYGDYPDPPPPPPPPPTPPTEPVKEKKLS